MQQSTGPLGFFLAARDIYKKMRKIQKDNPGLMKHVEAESKKEMHAHPWKNFFGSLFFCLVAGGFLALGIYIKSGWGLPIYRYIWTGFAGILLAAGIFTALSYLWIIIRKQ